MLQLFQREELLPQDLQRLFQVRGRADLVEAGYPVPFAFDSHWATKLITDFGGAAADFKLVEDVVSVVNISGLLGCFARILTLPARDIGLCGAAFCVIWSWWCFRTWELFLKDAEICVTSSLRVATICSTNKSSTSLEPGLELLQHFKEASWFLKLLSYFNHF